MRANRALSAGVALTVVPFAHSPPRPRLFDQEALGKASPILVPEGRAWYHSYSKHMIPHQESIASPRDERGGCPWLLEREPRKGSENYRAFLENL